MEEDELVESINKFLQLYDMELEEPLVDGNEVNYPELMEKTQDQLDHLNQRAEEVYGQAGMSREEIESYANNKGNFSSEQWEALQQVKEACDQFKTKSTMLLDQMSTEVEEAPPLKKRKKGERRFAKKKGWIEL